MGAASMKQPTVLQAAVLKIMIMKTKAIWISFPDINYLIHTSNPRNAEVCYGFENQYFTQEASNNFQVLDRMVKKGWLKKRQKPWIFIKKTFRSFDFSLTHEGRKLAVSLMVAQELEL